MTETEVPHDVAKAFSVEGFTVFCPPTYTTGPKGKEAGLIILVSNDITSFTVTRQDLNGKADTIPTAWIQLMNSKQNMDLIIGGVYRCSRTSVGDEKCEFVQLQQQILKAANLGKTVLVLGDINVDHNQAMTDDAFFTFGRSRIIGLRPKADTKADSIANLHYSRGSVRGHRGQKCTVNFWDMHHLGQSFGKI